MTAVRFRVSGWKLVFIKLNNVNYKLEVLCSYSSWDAVTRVTARNRVAQIPDCADRTQKPQGTHPDAPDVPL